MNTELADVYSAYSRLTKLQKSLRGSRYKSAVMKLLGYFNERLFPTKLGILAFDRDAVLYENTPIIKLDRDIDTQSFSSFSKCVVSIERKLLRSLVSAFVSPCEVSDGELVDIHRNLDDVFNTENANSTTPVNTIKKAIEEKSSNYVLIHGLSASGKTVATAAALDQTVRHGGTSYTWIDLSDVNIEVEHFLFTLIKADKKENHIVVIDNAQAYPSKITWILNSLDFMSSFASEVNFKLVCICWQSARKSILNHLLPKCTSEQVRQIYCSGYDTIIELIRSNALDSFENEILQNSNGDVLVANSIISSVFENGTIPNETKLADEMYKHFIGDVKLSENALKVLYTVVALGEFEIHVRTEYLESISSDGYRELYEHRLLRTYKTEDNAVYVSIGHRSMAHKLLVHLKPLVKSGKTPVSLAMDYLTIDGEDQILSTLERLDTELETNDSALAKLWQAFSNMRESVFKQISVDPTWGNNMASMIFAAEALNNMRMGEGVVNAIQRTSNEIRKRWQPAQGNTGIDFIGESNGIKLTSEMVDFTKNIKATMKTDETVNWYREEMLSENIDYQKFHDNWLLGLLLGFEGGFKEANRNKQAYLKCAEKRQLTTGAFYPDRVCWVTARVIMGLCECGMDYNTSSTVKKACNWLVQQRCDSNMMKWSVTTLKCSGWKSGTGSWNSDEQITLMCIYALLCANYPVWQNAEVTAIVNQFWQNRGLLKDLFTKKGTVLDIVWIIDVMLLARRNPIDMLDEIKDLTDFVLKNWSSASLLSSEKETESSDVSFMAKELLKIIWALLRKNIETLLSGLELDYKAPQLKKRIFISYRREEGGGSVFAQNLYKELIRHYYGDVFLDVYDMHKKSEDFNDVLHQAVQESEIVIAILTDHCFDRACSESYENKKDVLFNELNTAVNGNKNIITIYNSTARQPECPESLKVNKDFYKIAETLASRNASFYDATLMDAMQHLSDDVINKINHIFTNGGN